jgi:hypothetical protein
MMSLAALATTLKSPPLAVCPKAAHVSRAYRLSVSCTTVAGHSDGARGIVRQADSTSQIAICALAASEVMREAQISAIPHVQGKSEMSMHALIEVGWGPNGVQG